MADQPWFEWDDENIGHIAEHDVEPEEAEEPFFDTRKIAIEAHNVRGERRWGLLGSTEAGRLLAVIYTLRRRRIRVITVRDAEEHEIRRYHRAHR
jgi:uncharacterized protein